MRKLARAFRLYGRGGQRGLSFEASSGSLAAVERLTDFLGQFAGPIRLLKQRMFAFLHRAKDLSIGTVAGDKQHRHIGTIGAHSGVSFRAAKFWENDVEKHESDLVAMGAKFLDGLFTIVGNPDVITE